MDRGHAHLVHTEEAALVESNASTEETVPTGPGPLSSAVERRVHIADVVGSTPTVATIPMTRAGYPDWGSILAPYGFKAFSASADAHPADDRTVYIISSGELLKVGLATNVKARLRDLSLGAPGGLKVRRTYVVPRVLSVQVERQAHAALVAYELGREWFSAPLATAAAAVAPIARRARTAHGKLIRAGYYDRA